MAETDNPQPWETPEAEMPGQGPPDFASDEETPGPHTEKSQDARNLAMLGHILGIVGFLAPLVIWLSVKDEQRFVNEHGKDAMNYQISLMIYFAVAGPLCFVYVGLVLTPLLAVTHLALSIVAAIKAHQGQPWHYPIAIPFLR